MSNRVATLSKHLLKEIKPNAYRPNRAISVLDSYIAYVEKGSQKSKDCIVFLHGNPASSFLWRKVVTEVEAKASNANQFYLLCPDLIGHGRSGESTQGYDFFTHYKYLESWFDAVIPQHRKVILCIHDWGSGLGFHWAANHLDRVKGIVHMVREIHYQPETDFTNSFNRSL